jgi:hypothetical protein
MAAYRIVLSLAVALGGVAVSPGIALADDNRGTMEQQMACTPDVRRLCSDRIPDVDRIVGCLRQNTELLSAPCRAVFQPATGARPPRAPRGPMAPQRPADNDDDD